MGVTVRLLLLALSSALLLVGVEIPAGTPLQIRLLSKVDSAAIKPKAAVEAVLTAPVVLDGNVVLPAGALVHGRVAAVNAAVKGEDVRASLGLDFYQLQEGKSGRVAKLDARVSEVDNAREAVDTTNGKIEGINANETLTSRMDRGIQKLSQRYGALAGILQSVKGSVLAEANPEIVYEPGVEMTLVLTKPLTFDSRAPQPNLVPVRNEDALATLVNRQPFQTYTGSERPRPSDITNLMFIGSGETIERAFREAGWVSPQALSSESKMETFRAIAEMRGYKEGPFSLLVLDGDPPAMEFQKANNTFAMRHHLRIFRRPDRFDGKQVWVCSSTHDIAIDFSDRDRTFIHKIDPEIDRERGKVVADLMFTGRVRSLELVPRPRVPKEGLFNATGDPLRTDGSMAVVILN